MHNLSILLDINVMSSGMSSVRSFSKMPVRVEHL